MTEPKKIESEIAALPAHLHGVAKLTIADSNRHSSVDSPFFQAPCDAGFAGCIETRGQLSTNYKRHIDLSAMAGVHA